jgi:hypothetical protein
MLHMHLQHTQIAAAKHQDLGSSLCTLGVVEVWWVAWWSGLPHMHTSLTEVALTYPSELPQA